MSSPLSLQQLIEAEYLTAEIAALLVACHNAGLPLLISGDHSSTRQLANALKGASTARTQVVLVGKGMKMMFFRSKTASNILLFRSDDPVMALTRFATGLPPQMRSRLLDLLIVTLDGQRLTAIMQFTPTESSMSVTPILIYDADTGRLRPTGMRPRFVDALPVSALALPHDVFALTSDIDDDLQPDDLSDVTGDQLDLEHASERVNEDEVITEETGVTLGELLDSNMYTSPADAVDDEGDTETIDWLPNLADMSRDELLMWVRRREWRRDLLELLETGTFEALADGKDIPAGWRADDWHQHLADEADKRTAWDEGDPHSTQALRPLTDLSELEEVTSSDDDDETQRVPSLLEPDDLTYFGDVERSQSQAPPDPRRTEQEMPVLEETAPPPAPQAPPAPAPASPEPDSGDQAPDDNQDDEPIEPAYVRRARNAGRIGKPADTEPQSQATDDEDDTPPIVGSGKLPVMDLISDLDDAQRTKFFDLFSQLQPDEQTGTALHHIHDQVRGVSQSQTGTQQVAFTAYYPRHSAAEKTHGFFVYAHIPDALIAADIQTVSDQLGGTVPRPVQAAQKAMLETGASLTAMIHCDQLDFNQVGVVQVWEPPFVRFDFRFRAPLDCVDEFVTGRVAILLGVIEIASIDFQTLIAPPQPDVLHDPIPADPRMASGYENSGAQAPYQKIFISYSRRDTLIAEQYRQAQRMAGNLVFMDTHSIRAGEAWETALKQFIDEADIFQLFWSQHAAESDHVRFEWEYALVHRCAEDRCVNYIRPAYWRIPMPDPPDPLAHLHFAYIPINH